MRQVSFGKLVVFFKQFKDTRLMIHTTNKRMTLYCMIIGCIQGVKPDQDPIFTPISRSILKLLINPPEALEFEIRKIPQAKYLIENVYTNQLTRIQRAGINIIREIKEGEVVFTFSIGSVNQTELAISSIDVLLQDGNGSIFISQGLDTGRKSQLTIEIRHKGDLVGVIVSGKFYDYLNKIPFEIVEPLKPDDNTDVSSQWKDQCKEHDWTLVDSIFDQRWELLPSIFDSPKFKVRIKLGPEFLSIQQEYRG